MSLPVTPPRTSVVHAAGAVVWRERGGRLEVAVVHRPRYKDWSWPKGKLDPGESVAACDPFGDYEVHCVQARRDDQGLVRTEHGGQVDNNQRPPRSAPDVAQQFVQPRAREQL